MASYTDTNLPEFNPYIQQQPIQQMVEVGMGKQQQFDLGVERIQTSIDQIAGLDVIRGIDRKYLQAKMNHVGNQLKSVAAGDFSNFQLVNAVSGMTSQVTKDQNVINAVRSTQKYRKGVTEMEEANKAGKGGPGNDHMFKLKSSEWLNSEDVNQTFDYGYEQYSDYKSHAVEVFKALVPDSTITEEAFGQDKNGNLIIKDATVRDQYKGIPPERIAQALNAGLSVADFRQMEIDGVYNYANVPDEVFAQKINQQYVKDIEYWNKEKLKFVSSLSSTNDLTIRTDISNKINQINKQIEAVESRYQGISSAFSSGSTDGAKSQLQTMNFIEQFSKAFSYAETSAEYKENYFAKMK
ncbi:hypothetical protein, partial [Algoriphagus sp.]|uniref:hypothetical protein n=1 Tax=Algoriphagus sp. TaxID=1872435 RepID=UPI0025F37A84